MTIKQSLGSRGEQLAADFLHAKGYEILDHNYRIREGEIDIICRQNDCLVFVEVKTRSNKTFGWPEESVTDFKLEKILAAAFDYLQHYDLAVDWRIDVIGIIFDAKGNCSEIKQIEDVGA